MDKVTTAKQQAAPHPPEALPVSTPRRVHRRAQQPEQLNTRYVYLRRYNGHVHRFFDDGADSRGDPNQARQEILRLLRETLEYQSTEAGEPVVLRFPVWTIADIGGVNGHKKFEVIEYDETEKATPHMRRNCMQFDAYHFRDASGRLKTAENIPGYLDLAKVFTAEDKEIEDKFAASSKNTSAEMMASVLDGFAKSVLERRQ